MSMVQDDDLIDGQELDGKDQVGRMQVAEALSYRALADDLRRAA